MRLRFWNLSINWGVAVLLTTSAVALAGPEGRVPEKEKVITIEGSAPGTDANARDQAKQDALRRAVEQACGTFINTQTKTKDYQAVYDKVMSLAVGYVSEFEVLEFRKEEGTTHCKVRAKVSTVSFEREWAEISHTIEAEGNPRCVVVVVEDNDVDDTVPPKADGVAQSVIEHFFMDKGVQLMDKGGSENVRARDLELAAINNDINKLAAAAGEFKADVVIRGMAEGRRAGTSELGGRTVYKWGCTLSVRAYRTDSARLLMSNSYSTQKTSTNNNSGADEAIKECATENAGKILKDIAEAWRKAQNVRRICQVSIENCGRPDFKVFAEALGKVQGVQAVKLRELVNNVCLAEVDWSYDMETLAGRIEELKAAGASFEVTEQTQDRLKVKLVKQLGGGPESKE